MANVVSVGKWNGIVLSVFFLAFVGIKIWQLRVPMAVVRLKDTQLTVMVAKNMHHLRKGLGGRENLSPYDGMLSIFSPPSQMPIVMRDMQFSIDIVWFFGDTVVDIAKYVPIEPDVDDKDLVRYIPRKPANLVLELPAGWADSHNVKIGDKMVLISE